VRILAVYSGEYGLRHIANIRAHAPADWELAVWQAPLILPPVIDYPEDFLPASLPPCDLLLSFAEHRGVAELLPDLARLSGARAVIAAIDNEAWLPRGLARQLRGWLAAMAVACVTPKPLCSLTPTHFSLARREHVAYADPLIAAFAHRFGQPELRLAVDPTSRTIVAAEVGRDAVCGCARFVAERLLGVGVDEAEQEAGMLHHHFPCLASMGIDPDFGDTLMHVSGNLLRDHVAAQVKPYQQIAYIAPGVRSDSS
jgi:hypothetical protein